MKSADAQRNVKKNTLDNLNWRDQNHNIYSKMILWVYGYPALLFSCGHDTMTQCVLFYIAGLHSLLWLQRGGQQLPKPPILQRRHHPALLRRGREDQGGDCRPIGRQQSDGNPAPFLPPI